jgi:RNA polymerase sigma-70 factor (ECF subfamily)
VDPLVERFEIQRPRLRAIAFRLLGSHADADDVVQDAWLRLASNDTSAVDNLDGWLTTVVGRICLDRLRSRAARPELPLGPDEAEGNAADPEQEALLADSVGVALLVLLQTLTPAERLAFVLHDLFNVPFARIAPIVGRTEDATKMLASRARRRVRGATEPEIDIRQQYKIVEAFLAASRHGDFNGLLALLDPDVVVHADLGPGAATTAMFGAADVARQALAFSARAPHARLALVDGGVAIAVAPQERVVTVMTFAIAHGRIISIRVISDPERLRHIDPRPVPSTGSSTARLA